MLGLGVLGGYVLIALGQFFAIPAMCRRVARPRGGCSPTGENL